MQPFVAAGDVQAFLGSAIDPLKRIQEQVAFKAGLDATQADTAYKAAQVAKVAQDQKRQQDFAAAMQGYLANPTTDGLARIMGDFPEQREAAAAAFNVMDADRRQSELTQVGTIATVASGGDYTGAANLLRQRIEADTAAGEPEDPLDRMALQALESGDPEKRRSAVGLLALPVAIAAGTDKAKPFLEALGLSGDAEGKNHYILNGIVMDAKTHTPIAQDPRQRVEYRPDGSVHVTDPIPGIPMVGGGGTSPTAVTAPNTAPEPAAATVGFGVAPQAADFFKRLTTVSGGEPGASRDGGARTHRGRDFSGVRVGTPIPAPLTGELVATGQDGKSGWWGKWRLGNGSVISIAHLAKRPETVNVRAGEPLAIAGNTGNASTRGTDRAVIHVRAWGPDGGEVDPNRIFNGPKAVRRIRSVQEYNALKKGEPYIDPNGKARVKS